MAKHRHRRDEQRAGSRYDPVSLRSQSTQTLPVQTQPPTQLMSHEVHQYTQLVHHDLPEHVQVDTLVNDSDDEVSGDTVVLNDDDHPADRVFDWVPNSESLMVNLLEQNRSPAPCRDFPDSDATTEEGDAGKGGHDDADAESHLPDVDASPVKTGITTGDIGLTLAHSCLPEVDECIENRAALPYGTSDGGAAGTNNLKSSQSRLKNIASIRVSSLRASGIRAAGCNASLNTAGKNARKFDSDSTVDLTQRQLDEGSEKSQKGFEAGVHSAQYCQRTTATEVGGGVSPKLIMPSDNSLARISTPRSVSKGVAPTDNVPSVNGIKSHVDSDATFIAGIPNSASHRTGNTLANPGPISVRLRRFQSHASPASPIGGGDDARFDIDPERQTGQSNSQRARKLIFDYTETQPIDGLTSEGTMVSSWISRDDRGGLSKQTNGNQPTAPKNLSYVESHDPGEESQMNALNVIDKLVALDTSCMPDDIRATPELQDGSVRCHAGSKGLQSRAQAAQIKAMDNKLDVYEWEDTQLEEADPPNKKPFPTTARKQQTEAAKVTMLIKKQATSHQQKAPAIPPCSQHLNQITSIQGPHLEPLSSSRTRDAEIKPHTVLTTRLTNRTQADLMLKSKRCHSPKLQKGFMKHGRISKQKNELKKNGDRRRQSVEENIESKVQTFAPQQMRRAGRKKSVGESGRDFELDTKNETVDSEHNPQSGSSMVLKVTRQNENVRNKGSQEQGKVCKDDSNLQSGTVLADRIGKDDTAADIWLEAFSNSKNKRSSDKNADLSQFRKRNALNDDGKRGLKKLRASEPSSVTRDIRHLHMPYEQEEIPAEDDRVGKPQKIPEKSTVQNVTINAQCIGRGVKTGLTKLLQHNLDIAHSSGKELVDKDGVALQLSKKLKVCDSHQRKTSHDLKNQWNMLGKNESKMEYVTEQAAKPSKTGDLIKGLRKVGPDGFDLMDVSIAQNKGVEIAKLNRRPKTKPQGQDSKSRNGSMQKVATQKTKVMLSEAAADSDYGNEKSYSELCKCQTKELLVHDEHGTTPVNVEDEPLKERFLKRAIGREASDVCVSKSPKTGEELPADVLMRSKRGKHAGSVVVCEPGKAGDEVSAQEPKRRERGKHSADARPLGTHKNRTDAISVTDTRTHKSLQDVGGLKSADNDVSGSLKKARSSANICCSGRHDNLNLANKANFRGHSTSEEGKQRDAVVKASARSNKALSQQNKRLKALKALEKLSISIGVDEGRRKKRHSNDIHVLFSHSLTADAIKQQKKILAKLGGHLAMSALECTHFISNGFVRTQNMLVSMAAGKIVATTLWLESCGQAHYFVDEKNYILNDEKKEKELGFSMVTSLAAARRKPLFKDFKVIICPDTIPEPKALRTIVESAGGQVMDARASFPQAEKGDKPLIVIANEKGFDNCRQYLGKGLKVYSEELVLQGVVVQNLDVTRHQIFDNFR